jgi:flagellar FliJ protein
MGPIKRLADGKERDAGTALAGAKRGMEDHERQLAQLREYRAEYAARVSAGAAPDGVRLQNYHAFLARLGDAIAQQERAVEEAKAQVERATEGWRESRIEAASIGRAVDKLAVAERRAVDQRQQRETDERALQRTPRGRDPD